MRRSVSLGILLMVLLASVGCSANPSVPSQPNQPQLGQPTGPITQPPASTGVSQPVTPRPTTTLQAVDPSGNKTPEKMFTSPQSLTSAAMSPDARYVMMYAPNGDQVTPFVLDRNSGQLQQGKPMQIQPGNVTWSGRGFWVDGLTHLNLDLHVETNPKLRKALGLDDGMQLVAASFSADGNRVAALVGPARIDQTQPALSLDLILAKADGSSMVRVAKAVQPWWTPTRGPVALLSLSPDGSQLAITAESPRAALVNTSNPERAKWKAPSNMTVGGPGPTDQHTSPPGAKPLWSPDGQHVWMPAVGIVATDLTVTVAASSSDWGLAWQPDGKGILLGMPSATYGVAKVSGEMTKLALPPDVRPIGYLPDGRLLAETHQPS